MLRKQGYKPVSSASRVHHAKDVKKWLQEHRDRIEVFYLLAYSPELTPDEYLNNGLKQSICDDDVRTTKG